MIKQGSSNGKNYAYNVGRLCHAFGADTVLDALTTQRIANWRDKQLVSGKRMNVEGGEYAKLAPSRKEGLKASSINTYLKLLRTVLRKAHRSWKTLLRLPEFEMVKEKKTAKQQKPPRFLNEDEQKRLLIASPFYLRQFLLFLLGTGARKSEAITLTWDQIDNLLSNAEVAEVRFEHVPEEGRKTKGGKWRKVPLPQYVREMLVRMRDAQRANGYKGNRVFLGRDRGGRMWAEVKAMDPPFVVARRKAKLDGFVAGERITLHSMRHTYASRLAMADVPLIKIRDLLGHEDITTTQTYASLCPTTLAPAVKHLERFGRMSLAA